MDKIKSSTSFKEFIARFEDIELPFSLHSDSQFEINQNALPLSEALADEFIAPMEDFELDEFTEITPCFRFPVSDHSFALIYWIACIQKQCFVLATYDSNLDFVARAEISGTWLKDGKVEQAVARIEEDFFVFKAIGQTSGSDDYLGSPDNIKNINLQIRDDGSIQIL